MTASSIQHPASSIQHPASSIQHPASIKTDIYKRSRGFTLVELSIVIVIIGLIVAGVVAGQSLVKNAQKQALVTDINKYLVAINTFKMTYNGLPGDITNAQSYWPATTGGNGDRIIALGDPNFNGTERPLAWQQLSLAGLIQGNYTGNGAIVVGGNIPKAPFNNGLVGFYSTGFGVPPYGRPGKSYLAFYQRQTPVSNALGAGIISTADGLSIDLKIDDGTPHSGTLLCLGGIINAVACPGVTTATPSGTYNLNVTGNNNMLLWPIL